MRFLKKDPQSVDRAFATRLDAIADRGRSDTAATEDLQETSRPQIVKRRFWTPDEVEEAGSEEA